MYKFPGSVKREPAGMEGDSKKLLREHESALALEVSLTTKRDSRGVSGDNSDSWKRAEVLTNEKLSSTNLKEAQSRFIYWTDKVKVKSQSLSNSLPPHGLYSLDQNTGVGSCSLLQGNLLNPGIKPRSSTLQADSLPSEPPGKLKNTGLGSLSLLQGIFLTQVSNWDLLHCRQILYQLSYQGP